LLNPLNNYAASNCEECGACEKMCPQHIPVAKSLKKVAGKMEPFWLKSVLKLYMKMSFSGKVSKLKES